MLKNMVVDLKYRVGFFCLECDMQKITNKLISNVSSISYGNLESGNLDDSEWKNLDYYSKVLLQTHLFMDDTPSINVHTLRNKAFEMVHGQGAQILVIDYLQLLAGALKTGNRYEEMAYISRKLKTIAKELKVPIIACSQINRGVENRMDDEKYGDKLNITPRLSDLREMGTLEQDADIVCMIHRPEYYGLMNDSYGNDLKGKADFIIVKNRDQRSQTVRFDFEGDCFRFHEQDRSAPQFDMRHEQLRVTPDYIPF